MGSYYKFKIESVSEGVRFALYPNNSNTQALGVSGVNYPNVETCKRELESFREYVKNVDIREILDYGKISSSEWLPKLMKEGNVVFYKNEKPLRTGRADCERWADDVKKNIDAPIR
ncbi:hypothetical protein [Butyrivibrio sp. NC2007]|uniref:hypothetical protein n=1 Tax=Butyrivibrio sp. NC2007 TaxID=1280683 RepID=UPI0003B62856|nr:hypothetical protein [Butyrivibrio sp. NC2007]